MPRAPARTFLTAVRNGEAAPDMETALAEEARSLHAAFFPGEAPAQVVQRYVEANLRFETGEPDPALAKIFRLGLDLEAVELWLRLRRKSPAPTRRIQILFYLLEARARYYPWFVGESESRPRAVAALLGGVVRSGWKFAKGAYQVRRHRLV